MRGGDRPWRPRPVSPAPSPVSPVPPAPPGIPGCPCSEGTPGGKRRSQRLHPFTPPSFHPSFSPSFQPFTLPSFSPLSPTGVGGFILPQREKSGFLLKIKGKKNPQSGLNSQSTPQPHLHVHLVGAAPHSQAETISSSLVRSSRVYLSHPLILLTLLLFGPNPISSVHSEDSETTHFCCAGGGWLGAPPVPRPEERDALRGQHSLQRKSLKGNFARDKKTHIQFPDYCFPARVIYFGNRTFNKRNIHPADLRASSYDSFRSLFLVVFFFSSFILFNFSP